MVKNIIEVFDEDNFGENEAENDDFKMKEVTINELAKIVNDMPFEKILDFAEEYRDEEFCNWFAIQKMNWLDNDIILIGGYHQNTRTLDLQGLGKDELIDEIGFFINNYFNCQGLNNTVYV